VKRRVEFTELHMAVRQLEAQPGIWQLELSTRGEIELGGGSIVPARPRLVAACLCLYVLVCLHLADTSRAET